MRLPARRARASRRIPVPVRKRPAESMVVWKSANQFWSIHIVSAIAQLYQPGCTCHGKHNSMTITRLPNYIRTYRKRSCLTQDEVAFLLGSKSGASVSRHERFKQTPDLQTLLAY